MNVLRPSCARPSRWSCSVRPSFRQSVDDADLKLSEAGVSTPLTGGSRIKKVKVAHTRLPSVGFRSCIPVFVSQPAGDVSHKPGGRLPLLSARPAVTPQPLRGLLPVLLLVEQKHDGCEQFAKTVIQHCRDCDLNPALSAPESSTLPLGFRATQMLPGKSWGK